MLLGARQFFERRGAPTPPLPYDAEVEYLESTGTQWIDTGFVATGGCVMEFSFCPQSFGNSCCAMGSHSKTYTNAYNRNCVLFNSSSFLTFAKCEKYSQSWAGVDLSSGFHTYYFDSTGYNRIGKVGDTVRINDTTQYELAPDTNVLMWIYGWDNHIMSGRFAWAKIWDPNGVLVRDYIAVRFTNELGQSEGAMYDRVSGQLFRNQGTGSFAIGPDKVEWTNPYVTDGLVAMWDGEWNAGGGVHDASATSWLDLIGNKQMPTTLSSLSWESDALVRTGVDGLSYDTGLDFSDALSERTFEFVISYDADYTDTSSNYFIARLNDLGTWLSFWNRLKFGISLYAGAGAMETPFEQPSFKGSVSLVGSSTPYVVNPTQRHYAYYYANGTLFRDGAFGGGASSSAIIDLFAAARNWPSSNTIKMHAIRIYSRALTAAEIAANYAIDKARFNLP